MTPKKFDYFAPVSISGAIELLQEKEDSKVLAGGQSLLALMKLRLAAPAVLVDITKLRDMSYVRQENDYVAIGALTIHDFIEHNEIIKNRFPILVDAASKIEISKFAIEERFEEAHVTLILPRIFPRRWLRVTLHS